jgi:SnoaL-like protein
LEFPASPPLAEKPVILVAGDGRSASIRSRLFEPGWRRTRAMGLGGGMYHDQVVLEAGVWKVWSVTIDEHYFLVADVRRRLVDTEGDHGPH